MRDQWTTDAKCAVEDSDDVCTLYVHNVVLFIVTQRPDLTFI